MVTLKLCELPVNQGIDIIPNEERTNKFMLIYYKIVFQE